LELEGDTETEATGTEAGALTLNVADAVFPSLVAVIIALPGERAETSPLLATVATLGLPLCHVTTRPLKVFPAESSNDAVARAV
jgi:hypothetical protein